MACPSNPMVIPHSELKCLPFNLQHNLLFWDTVIAWRETPKKCVFSYTYPDTYKIHDNPMFKACNMGPAPLENARVFHGSYLNQTLL